MSEQSDALNHMFHQPQWVEVIKIEQKFREDQLLKMIAVKVDDPAYDKKVAYHKGAVEAITLLWALRDVCRREKPKEKNHESHHEAEAH